MSGTPLLKVCCIASEAEARLAIDAGAAALGLVSAMPSGPGVIDEATIAQIAVAVNGEAETFLLTSLQSVQAIEQQWHRCRTTTLQLVDRIEDDAYAELRRRLPQVRLVQVIHVTGEASFDEARALWDEVDALLLDSGNPGLAVKELGGTGRTHDWSVSGRICESSPVPVFLAGGLRPDNVAEAIRAVRPDGIDVCSGLRGPRGLDPERLGAFRRAMASA